MLDDTFKWAKEVLLAAGKLRKDYWDLNTKYVYYAERELLRVAIGSKPKRDTDPAPPYVDPFENQIANNGVQPDNCNENTRSDLDEVTTLPLDLE